MNESVNMSKLSSETNVSIVETKMLPTKKSKISSRVLSPDLTTLQGDDALFPPSDSPSILTASSSLEPMESPIGQTSNLFMIDLVKTSTQSTPLSFESTTILNSYPSKSKSNKDVK